MHETKTKRSESDLATTDLVLSRKPDTSKSSASNPCHAMRPKKSDGNPRMRLCVLRIDMRDTCSLAEKARLRMSSSRSTNVECQEIESDSLRSPILRREVFVDHEVKRIRRDGR